MTSDKGVVERLRGADPDHVSAIDALRLHDHNSVTFPLSAEDVEGVLDLVDEAAARIETLERALRPFARIADMTDDEADGASVIVNVSRCREARAALSPSTNSPEK